MRLERLGSQAAQLAQRFGKPTPEIHVEDHGVRLDPDRWSSFWSAFVHVVRHAVDHGLEPAEDREAAAKPCAGALWLSAQQDGSELVVQLRDDGRRINWEDLRDKAHAQGLTHASHVDLEAAIFADGVSTRDEVTAVSGRGVGMAAVKEAVVALGGRITIGSNAGRGTTFEFRFPLAAASVEHAA